MPLGGRCNIGFPLLGTLALCIVFNTWVGIMLGWRSAFDKEHKYRNYYLWHMFGALNKGELEKVATCLW